MMKLIHVLVLCMITVLSLSAHAKDQDSSNKGPSAGEAQMTVQQLLDLADKNVADNIKNQKKDGAHPLGSCSASNGCSRQCNSNQSCSCSNTSNGGCYCSGCI